jgi:hypothetical protein
LVEEIDNGTLKDLKFKEIDMKFTLISENIIDSSKTVVEFTGGDINKVLVKMKEFLLASGYQSIKGDLEFVENNNNIFLGDDTISLPDYDDSFVLAGSMDDNMAFTLSDMAGAQPTVSLSLEDLDQWNDPSFVLGDRGLGVKT